MRLSTVCELLLIFLIIAFGAYGRVIERNGDKPRQIAKSLNNDKNIGVSLMSLKDATENVNKYCQCDGIECTCCRAFPLIGINILKNEGCAVLKYVENNSLKVQLKYGGRELATRVIKGKSPAPICIPLPGGFSDFCAKVYSIKREENNQFKACLGLELKSGGDVEAAVRVSCFRFDKKQDNKTEKIPDKKQETITEKIPEKTPEITTEIALETTTVHQDNDITTEQTFDNTTPKEVGDGLVTEESSTTDTSNPTESTLETTTFISEKIEEKPIKGSESVVDIVTAKPEIPAMVVKKIILGTHKKASAGSSNLNKIENDKQKPLIKPTKADSTPVQQVTPTNNNDIIDLGELVGLTDDEETESIEDNDDDDDEENEDKSNEEEKDENVEVGETNKPDNDDDDEEEADILDSLDDDSEEQEVNAAINAIVGTDNNKNKNNNNNKIKINDKISDKVADNMASKPEDDDADYGMNLAEFMARGRHINHGRSRQSKVMRL
ncbi:hypothetical protein HCN44_004927 [Aphidius gifuensis]|uniref:DUF4773 domain-containing protein n=1 Tax=Aphidius gifuensis TaxID=684658 RepID=A0A835CST3_APHGI|nr:hypothetical protein HCN44_004927 [Aphidius gifuensis]